MPLLVPLSGRGTGSGIDSVPGLSTPLASDPEVHIDSSIIADDVRSASSHPVENAADVVDRIDRGALVLDALSESPNDAAESSGRPSGKPTLEIIDESPPPSVDVDIAELEAVSAMGSASAEPAPSESEEASASDLEEVDEDLIIHERKAVETDFDDEVPTPVALPEPEKPSYVLPPINLLDYEGDGPAPVDQLSLKERATRLEEKLRTYGVEGKVTAIRPGPVVTTYEYQPAPGVKVAKIANLADDIAMSMEAVRVRIVAPIPGRGVVGIELPNDKRENVYLKEIIAHEAFKHSKSLLTLALGKDAEGDSQVRDLRKMPHLMIAGTTGSGKSVSINTMVLSMLYKATPDEVKFIMVDPKMLELSLYNDIPHLLLPVVTDPKKASLALAWTVDEMERRYQLLSDAKVRDIQGFNRKLEKLRKQREKDAKKKAEAEAEGPEVIVASDADAATPSDPRLADPWGSEELPASMPFIVVLIDEFADLMMAAPRDVEASVQRLAQKARAAGIHVLLATQRPSTDVITGVIKNNFPSRLAFRVASRHDSATVLNTPGAENLLGMGDSLFLSVASPNPVRVHGAF
ncbi:MAG: DNA translocase FtsK, partial [Myxococcota bacterium]